jgi:hypothetical protein
LACETPTDVSLEVGLDTRPVAVVDRLLRRDAQSALCESELGAGDVLVATEKQDCSDAPDPSEHEY